MAYLVKYTYINKDENGNITYYKGKGVTCYSKISADDYYEYLINKSNIKDVVIEKI